MKSLQTNKGKISFQVRGQADQGTILFLNGVMASMSSWASYEKLFNQLGYQTITFDFIGQLTSDKPEGPYTFDQHVLEAIALLEHLNLKQVHVVGTSYGSEVGMLMAIKYPQYVQTLSLIDGTAKVTEHMRDVITQWSESTYKGGKEFFMDMMPTIYHSTYIEENYDLLMCRAQKLEGQEEYLRGQRILYETFLNEVDFLNELHQISCPTLVVVGCQDTLKPPSCSQAIVDRIKNSEYILFEECGHVSIFEKENELKTVLCGFITKNNLKEE